MSKVIGISLLPIGNLKKLNIKMLFYYFFSDNILQGTTIFIISRNKLE